MLDAVFRHRMPSLFFTILNMCAFYSHTGISLVSQPQRTNISYANIFSWWLSQCARFLFCGCLSLFYVAAFPQKYVSYWEFVQYCMYITVRVCISVCMCVPCEMMFLEALYCTFVEIWMYELKEGNNHSPILTQNSRD